MAEKDKNFELEIVTPEGVSSKVNCDSAHLTLADGCNEKGGGSFGIRKGHARSVLLLSEGTTTAMLDGKVIFSAKTGEGFAVMDGDRLSVTVCRAYLSE